MDMLNEGWLPHISPEVASEVKGSYLDAYLIALEGWRRGLTLKWHHKYSPEISHLKTWFIDEPGQVFSLHSKEVSHYFFRTRGDKIPSEAVEQGMDKHFTKLKLSEAGVPVPKGKTFAKNEDLQKVLTYIKSIGYPVVLKPVDGSFGRGVFVNLHSEKEVEDAFNYIINTLNEDVIVEQYISGRDYRLYVVGDKVVGAILRVPPNVVGDGFNSIKKLIEEKNNKRLLNPRLKDCLIQVNEELIYYLFKKGYTIDDVPKEGEYVDLSEKANISIGGDPVDVLDEMSTSIKQVAINALQSIKGLYHGAVDLMIGSTTENSEKAYVIELNPTAQLGGILFPIEGSARDIPKEIIDYYFPMTQRYAEASHLYFEGSSILQPLINNVARNVVVKKLEFDKIVNRKFKLSLKVDINQFNLIKREALSKNLNGRVFLEKDTHTVVLVSGSEHEVNEFEQLFKQRFNIEYEKSGFLKEEIMVGFKLDKGSEYMIEQIKEKQKQNHLDQRNIQKLNKEYKKLINSTSWKITKPMRKIIAFVNEKK